jgi:hypothetical protein
VDPLQHRSIISMGYISLRLEYILTYSNMIILKFQKKNGVVVVVVDLISSRGEKTRVGFFFFFFKFIIDTNVCRISGLLVMSN